MSSPRGTQPRASAGAAAEHDEALDRFSAAFRGAMGAVRRLRGRDTHRPGELSYAQFGLLFGLFEAGELSASELAVCADVAPGTATQMLDSLTGQGLIIRRRSEHDRRCVLVSLTALGREVVAARKATYQRHWEQALAEFTPADLNAAAAVLDRMRVLFGDLALEAEHGELSSVAVPAA
jgi:DNA-binding MarR family transcriptional regulator